MELGDLPQGTRVKLPGKAKEQLWQEVDRKEVSEFAGEEFDRQDIYNWKSKDLFLPAGFVHRAIGDYEDEIVLKSGGNGKKIELELPLEVPDELYTRMASVNVNNDNVTVYRPKDSSLVDRFVKLLERFDIGYRVYHRSGPEVRFPYVFYRIVRESNADTDFAALVDEEGEVTHGKLVAAGRETAIEEFDGELHSRDKKLELAVERGDSEEIEKMIREETGRVRKAFS